MDILRAFLANAAAALAIILVLLANAAAALAIILVLLAGGGAIFAFALGMVAIVYALGPILGSIFFVAALAAVVVGIITWADRA